MNMQMDLSCKAANFGGYRKGIASMPLPEMGEWMNIKEKQLQKLKYSLRGCVLPPHKYRMG